jgi:dienelactone hydrolase
MSFYRDMTCENLTLEGYQGAPITATDAAVEWMRAEANHNGKIGIFGSCSGGRHAFIYACQRKDVDA